MATWTTGQLHLMCEIYVMHMALLFVIFRLRRRTAFKVNYWHKRILNCKLRRGVNNDNISHVLIRTTWNLVLIRITFLTCKSCGGCGSDWLLLAGRHRRHLGECFRPGGMLPLATAILSYMLGCSSSKACAKAGMDACLMDNWPTHQAELDCQIHKLSWHHLTSQVIAWP